MGAGRTIGQVRSGARTHEKSSLEVQGESELNWVRPALPTRARRGRQASIPTPQNAG